MMKIALCGLLLAAVAALTSAQDHIYPAEGINNRTLSYGQVPYSDATGASLQGYFAYDNSTTTKRGLVLVIPDWDGIGNYERWRADLLASLGYAAFVADIYTTSVAQGPSLPMANRSMLTTMYTGNQTLLVDRMLGAFDTAKKQAVVDTSNIVAIGYCFGGGAVLQLARSWPNPSISGLKGVVAFHGAPLAYKTGDKNFTVGNPIVIAMHNGYVDPSNNASQIASIKNELESAQITFQFTDYGETVHAFTEPDLPAWTPSTTSMAYSEYADISSWWSLRAFLLYVFGKVDEASNPYTGETGVWDTTTEMLATS